MKKVLSITIKNTLNVKEESRNNDFKELNEHLSDDWSILNYDFINSNTATVFTAVYLIEKR